MSKYCYWSVADGNHAEMMKTVIKSARNVGVKEDFHIWSDREIDGAICHDCGNYDKQHYLFKFKFLKEQVALLDYDYFIFLDADTYFVRNPGDILRVLYDAPIHVCMESDCAFIENKRSDWWGCPLDKYIELMREKGVRSKAVYNTNAGFWIVKKDIIETFYRLAMDFWNHCKNAGHIFTEEAPLAYVGHMLMGDVNLHTLKSNKNIWASDWTGNYKDCLPDGKPWLFEDYMSGQKFTVNPDIVHAMRSKDVLRNSQIEIHIVEEQIEEPIIENSQIETLMIKEQNYNSENYIIAQYVFGKEEYYYATKISTRTFKINNPNYKIRLYTDNPDYFKDEEDIEIIYLNPILPDHLTSNYVFNCWSFWNKALSDLADNEILIACDIDTLCVNPIKFSEHTLLNIKNGKIGIVEDVDLNLYDYDHGDPNKTMYIPIQDRQIYMNIGVMFMIKCKKTLNFFQSTFKKYLENPKFYSASKRNQCLLNYEICNNYKDLPFFINEKYNSFRHSKFGNSIIFHWGGGRGDGLGKGSKHEALGNMIISRKEIPLDIRKFKVENIEKEETNLIHEETNLIHKKIKNVNFFIRKKTWDETILREIDNCYMKLEYDLNDGIIIDIGAHIGGFTKFIKTLSPRSHILSFEPNKNNFDMLKMNTKEMSNTEIFNLGVYGDSCTREFSFLSDNNNTGEYRTSFTEHQKKNKNFNFDKIKCVGINDILDDFSGIISLLKIDCEGSEWSIFKNITSENLKRINCIIGEFHPRQPNELQIEILSKLKESGFNVMRYVSSSKEYEDINVPIHKANIWICRRPNVDYKWKSTFKTCKCASNCSHSLGFHSYFKYYKEILDNYKPSHILEWGPGLNTKMAIERNINVDSIEFNHKYVSNINSNLLHSDLIDINSPNFINIPDRNKYDLFFVDSRRRNECLQACFEYDFECIVCLHDAQRERYHNVLKQFKYVIFLNKGFCVASNQNLPILNILSKKYYNKNIF
jgi:FkbM family methyltransferase